MQKRNAIWVIALSLSTLAILRASSAIAQTQTFANHAQAEFKTGDPIPDVDVSIGKKPGGKIVAKAKTGTDGGFIFKNLPAGTYVLVVQPPALANAGAKSFFESRSNTVRLEISLMPKKTTSPLVVDLLLKGDKLVRILPEGSSNNAREMTANRPVQSERESEITIEVADGQSVIGKITGRAKRRA